MGEIHSFTHTTAAMPSTRASSDLASFDQSSTYPPTWHEYEDQFNYFYNCHFIEQDYYDYLASGYQRQFGGANTNASSASSSARDENEDKADEDDEGSELDQDIVDYSYDSSCSNEEIHSGQKAVADMDIADIIDPHMSDISEF
ncbi:hypothetical protein J3B02_001301 [Coemansia erecta]|nr:hypothetical protein J3B02_001301 [Coemansia erecta]